MKEGNKVCSLEQELAAKAHESASQHDIRERQLVDLTLRHIVDGVDSKETDILNAMSGKGASKHAVINIIEKEVERSSDGLIWCSNYSARSKGDQKLHIFTGCHWETIAPQQWKDFIGQCAEKCGLPESLRMDYSFMNRLFEGVAFNVSKYRMNQVPDDVVLLNLPNGTLCIKADGSVSIREHDKNDLFFYCLRYNYDPMATCEQWQKFLDRVLPDANDQQMLKEYICYVLMHSHKFEKMLWLYGSGQNGKSVTLGIIEELLGKENVSNLSLVELTTDQKTRAGIEHKLLNISYETGRFIDPNVMKQIISGEPVLIENKYENARQITDYGKLIISTNRLPKSENTAAFFRRIIILPFTAVISDEEKDVHLIDKLKTELPGIMNWALSAFPGLMERQAFTTSESSEQAMAEYKLESDNVHLFLSEMLEPSEKLTSGQILFEAYQSYCKSANLQPLGRTHFFRRLEQLTQPRINQKKVAYFKLKLV